MSNNVTKLGKYLRRLCVDAEQPMKDMAKVLGYSNSFLSAIELGKKPLPDPVSFVDTIIDKYSLTKEQSNELEQAAAGACKTLPIDIDDNTGQYLIGLARAARSTNDLEKLKEMINEL